jgi:hypothetical protein
MQARNQRSGFPKLFARPDASGLLYGAVVSGGALAATSSHADASTRVAVATFAVLVIYWLAHVYIQTLSKQLGGADTRPLMPRIVTAAREEAIVLFGGIPTVAVYVAVSALGGTVSTAAFAALFFLVALLFTVGYLGARQAELTGLRAAVEAVGAGVFGVLIVIMKALLH